MLLLVYTGADVAVGPGVQWWIPARRGCGPGVRQGSLSVSQGHEHQGHRTLTVSTTTLHSLVIHIY